MKLFIVENKSLDMLNFFEAIAEHNWTQYSFSLNKTNAATDEELRRFLAEVCEQRPDIVVLDAALTVQEEKHLDKLGLEGGDVSEDSLSGFKYCRALYSERLGIPIVFLTRSKDGNVARMAMLVGADRVLLKRATSEHLIPAIEALVSSRTRHDSAFYWPLRQEMNAGRDMWQEDVLRRALDRYFLNVSPVRRFGLFTASLRDIMSFLFQGDVTAEKKLVLSLVKSQVLLALVDPGLRDHVKHTGNVFWMGYRLLHEIPEFCNPTGLDGCVPRLYDSSGTLSARDQMLYSWTLAALFHDYGYVDERQGQIKGLFEGLVPGASIASNDVRDEPAWRHNLQLLRDFVSGLLGHDHFLYHFIDTVRVSFGSMMDCNGGKTKSVLLDHGFLSAHRLLCLVPMQNLDAQRRSIVLHAALAIACHNHSHILRKWKFDSKCVGAFSIGTFPVSSMLSFCDTVQTWDRDVDVDPVLARTEAYDALLERLVLSDTSYVKGSEICEFSTTPVGVDAGYDVKVKLRYFVEAAGGVNSVCESLGGDIQRWIDSRVLDDVCRMTGVSSLLHGEIVYELPMLSGKRKVSF